MMKTKALILLIATIAFGIAPFITPPFTGYDPGMFPVPIERPSIQPAGYAFSIWSVIYLWLIAHAVYGLWKRAENPAWDAVRLPLTVAVGVGAVWLWIAGVSAIWGTVTIWIMAAGAILAFLRADPGVDRWMLSGPTAIFAGWLSAASAVSTGVLVAGYGWLSDTGSAAAMLALVLGIAVTVQMRRPAMPVYGLTVIWALVGVIVANASANLTVAVLAASGIAVMAVTLWQVPRVARR
ncbi:hypothetical protein EI545_18040 [Tabrizicola piscis]|uniref:Tryptophan-rich sensory protein n=1 Tax=Tabrizicola piscis TaxID=2494374 RepID=A0A3S8UAI3_9RHOB|nr:hypothetical protein [Tabrizicola piscis]AZL60559.1 hypothetical protein EI545_18040 [Tabrizicola piscis]